MVGWKSSICVHMTDGVRSGVSKGKEERSYSMKTISMNFSLQKRYLLFQKIAIVLTSGSLIATCLRLLAGVDNRWSIKIHEDSILFFSFVLIEKFMSYDGRCRIDWHEKIYFVFCTVVYSNLVNREDISYICLLFRIKAWMLNDSICEKESVELLYFYWMEYKNNIMLDEFCLQNRWIGW